MAPPQLPDITERYQVMLGLPTDDIAPAGQAEMGGGEAAESAKIAKSDTEKLRAHVRSCSALPGSVARTDKVRIVMRIALTPQGRLRRAADADRSLGLGEGPGADAGRDQGARSVPALRDAAGGQIPRMARAGSRIYAGGF